MTRGLTAHMVTKNEDKWVWYAINSVLPYVDKILITDTGSTDDTVKIIESIRSPKIVFNQTKINSREDISKVRQSHIDKTATNWIWIVDGDEIYPNSLAKEVVDSTASSKYSLVVVRRHDLIGDIYHKQLISVGSYKMFGETGHLLVRLLNLSKLKGLHVKGDYPLESYYTSNGERVNDINRKNVYITKGSLFHAMYLKRSSLGSNLPMFNRGKYKIETGVKINDSIPEVFTAPRPDFVPSPLSERSLGYKLAASIITPIKKLKRKIL